MLTTSGGDRQVFLSAQWRWLAVLNYEIDPALLERYVPRGVELDFDTAGKTYVSLVGFLFRDTRVLGWKIPGHRDFEELNLRFYVVRHEAGEARRGVVFVKELVPRLAVSTVARWFYNENYQTVPMRHTLASAGCCECGAPAAAYEFRHRGRWNRVSVAGGSQPFYPAPGEHEAFILEHYWGYCGQRDGTTIEYRVDHPPWQVWPAAAIDVDADFAAIYGEVFGRVLAREPDSAFLAEGSAVQVFWPRRVEAGSRRFAPSNAGRQ
jgi:uncharacterized protein YqjF (DUF2071 family)